MSLLHAHLVFVTKYRRRMFTDAMLPVTQAAMLGVRAELDVELVEFNGETDHVPLLVAHPPILAISVLAQRLTGHTAHQMRRQFTGACARARVPSYFAVSCGAAPLSIIKQYIDGQARPL